MTITKAEMWTAVAAVVWVVGVVATLALGRAASRGDRMLDP